MLASERKGVLLSAGNREERGVLLPAGCREERVVVRAGSRRRTKIDPENQSQEDSSGKKGPKSEPKKNPKRLGDQPSLSSTTKANSADQTELLGVGCRPAVQSLVWRVLPPP